MSSLPVTNYYNNPNSNTLSILLNGADYLMDSPFMTKLFESEKKKGHSAVSFNFPFQERGEDHSSGEELIEERGALKEILENYANIHVKKVRLIAKSLGSIVAIKYLESLPEEKQSKYSLIILGTPLRYMTQIKFGVPVTVIQGSEDKNGGIEEVKKFLVI